MQAESSLMPQRPSSGCLRMWALGDRVAGAQVLAATGQAGWLAGRQFAVTVQAMASKTKPSESVPGSPNAYSILGTAYFINDFSLSQLFD